MSTPFSIVLGSTDSDSNTSSRTLASQAGAIQWDPPQVSFVFPTQVAVTSGSPTGPQWDGASSQGFAFCKVTPTPALDTTDRFHTQAYYDVANYPNAPSRRFSETHQGSSTTLATTLQASTTFSLTLISGGGEAGLGFAAAADPSGLRRALVLSAQDQSASVSPERQGGRIPVTDGLLTAYDHNLTTDVLYTLGRLQVAKNPDGTTRTQWSAGTYIWPHPYHYVPLYENNGGTAVAKTPVVLVIQEDAQYPLTGQFTVSGTAVSGTWGQLTSELSGTQFAFRVNGAGDWYVLNGAPANDNEMTIHDYGDNPYATQASLEAIAYAVGSGTISVLPNLAGCGDWDVALSPSYNDGAAVPNLNAVTYTANLVEVNPGGAPSGTAIYDWVVTPQGGSPTSYLNQGASLVVDYANQPLNVTVQVSGTGQPTCIHADDTGYISLVNSTNPGIWDQSSLWATQTDALGDTQYRNDHTWDLKGSAISGTYYHHHVYECQGRSAALVGTWYVSSTEILVEKGSLTTWPSAGTAIVAQAFTSDTGTAVHLYCTYTGKQSLSTYDKLTGVTVQYRARAKRTHGLSDVGTGAGTVSSCSASAGYKVYQQTQHHFPMTFVTGKVNSTTLRVEDAQRVVNARAGTTKRFWLCASTTDGTYRQRLDLASVNLTANEITFTQPVSTNLAVAGSMLVLAPWNHWFTGGVSETVVPTTNWALGHQSLLFLDAVNGQNSATIDIDASFTLRCLDPLYYSAAGTTRQYPWLWIPLRGRLAIPSYDRTTVVVAYDSWTSTVDANGDSIVTFQNCLIVQGLSSGLGTTHTFTRGGALFSHKEIDLVATAAVESKTTADPDLTKTNAGLNRSYILFSWNQTWADLLQASQSLSIVTGATGVSDQGQPLLPGTIASLSPNAMLQVDPIYWPVQLLGLDPGGPLTDDPFYPSTGSGGFSQ